MKTSNKKQNSVAVLPVEKQAIKMVKLSAAAAEFFGQDHLTVDIFFDALRITQGSKAALEVMKNTLANRAADFLSLWYDTRENGTEEQLTKLTNFAKNHVGKMGGSHASFEWTVSFKTDKKTGVQSLSVVDRDPKDVKFFKDTESLKNSLRLEKGGLLAAGFEGRLTAWESMPQKSQRELDEKTALLTALLADKKAKLLVDLPVSTPEEMQDCKDRKALLDAGVLSQGQWSALGLQSVCVLKPNPHAETLKMAEKVMLKEFGCKALPQAGEWPLEFIVANLPKPTATVIPTASNDDGNKSAIKLNPAVSFSKDTYKKMQGVLNALEGKYSIGELACLAELIQAEAYTDQLKTGTE